MRKTHGAASNSQLLWNVSELQWVYRSPKYIAEGGHEHRVPELYKISVLQIPMEEGFSKCSL